MPPLTSKDKGKGKALTEEKLEDGDEVKNIKDDDPLSYSNYGNAMKMVGDKEQATNENDIDVECGDEGDMPHTTLEKVRDELTVTDELENENNEEVVQFRLAAEPDIFQKHKADNIGVCIGLEVWHLIPILISDPRLKLRISGEKEENARRRTITSGLVQVIQQDSNGSKNLDKIWRFYQTQLVSKGSAPHSHDE